ncbi:GIM4 [Sanghuangporus sanghuang]
MATTAASSSSSQSKGKASTKTLGAQELQQTLSRLQNELQALAAKIGELESEAEEHELVLSTLNEALQSDPQRKCFRMVGGVLVERTVKDVVPALQTNKEGIKKVVANLLAQYKAKDDELESLKREYNVRPITRG